MAMQIDGGSDFSKSAKQKKKEYIKSQGTTAGPTTKTPTTKKPKQPSGTAGTTKASSPVILGPRGRGTAPFVPKQNSYVGDSGVSGGSRSSGGSFGGFSSGSGGLSASMTGTYSPTATDVPPTAPPEDSYYLEEKAGIDNTLAELMNALGMQRTNYDVDFGQALRNLGWSGPEGGSIDDVLSQGQWDRNNRLGAYGAAEMNQTNDYANRGMSTSSFYQKALDDLLASFNNQRSDLVDGRTQFLGDISRQEAEGKTAAEEALRRAQQNAAARQAAMYGL